ncbi:uncharacterized protein CPUR_04390 [Claviceps purpurea 20.1]|uniref:Uncharacterized protein n=1 Tax=Claviceps purpurea (strain 20.1) TaxID=1111077 RepID=M1VW27_CLAP2|nr:uncharacterized protein CPUR_04390 [Claviceps purpurea 20.1]
MKAADPKVAKFPYIKFRGAPHESPKTDEPYHASAVLRKESKDEYAGKLYVARIEATKDTAPGSSPKPQKRSVMAAYRDFLTYPLVPEQV